MAVAPLHLAHAKVASQHAVASTVKKPNFYAAIPFAFYVAFANTSANGYGLIIIFINIDAFGALAAAVCVQSAFAPEHVPSVPVLQHI